MSVNMYHTLYITNKDKFALGVLGTAIQKLIESGNDNFFEAIIPMPNEITEPAVGAWITDNIGNCSKANKSHLTGTPESLRIIFHTMGGQPLKLYQHLEARGFEVTATYDLGNADGGYETGSGVWEQ